MQNLGILADRLYETRQQRLELQRQVKALEAEESELKSYFLEQLPNIEATGVQGNYACVTLSASTVPTVRDWGAIYSYIYERKAWHLLQRRLNEAAIKEMWQDGGQIPGIEGFEVQKISVTKRG